MPKEAIWFNALTLHNIKSADAFLLRLFKGRIVKIANADDIVSVAFKSQRWNNGKF